jgi:uncharacterized membrane protein YedE/YeeE
VIQAAAGAGLLALAAGVAAQPGGSWRLAALAITGALIGATLLRTSFGFANAFRAVVDRGDLSGLRAHAAMIALASLLMLPMLAMGHVAGQPMAGEATRVGVGFAVGALLFGAGMQVGGGCASGTLFSLGGGDAKLAGTLAGFVLGSTLGAAHMGFWWSLPSLPGATAQGLVGFGPALALQLAMLGALAWVAGPGADRVRMRALVRGGLALACLNALTLLLSGHPWGETSAFALWGSQLAAHIGFDPAHWAYWQRPGFGAKLRHTPLLDVSSVMDAAIVLGAVLAAARAGLFRPRLGGGPLAWSAAVLGGVAMGYGARLANGCNIGAYFSALSMGNLSGWAWMVLALAGSWVGARLRPVFGLSGRRGDGPAC